MEASTKKSPSRKRDQLQRSAGRCSGLASIFTAAVFLAFSPAAQAAEITEHKQYYEVPGQSLREANEQMFIVSPIVANGEKFAAGCRPEVTWQFTTASGAGWCALTSTTVSVRITYTMPRWTGYAGAPFAVQEKWDQFFAQLLLHEEGHARRAKEAVRKAEQELQGLKRSSCRELNEAIDEKHGLFVMQLTALNADYDAGTGHGDLQNAVLDGNALIAKEEGGD